MGPSAGPDGCTSSSPLARNLMGLRSPRARARRRTPPPFGSLPARARGRGAPTTYFGALPSRFSPYDVGSIPGMHGGFSAFFRRAAAQKGTDARLPSGLISRVIGLGAIVWLGAIRRE
jgi:hypothetical protein